MCSTHCLMNDEQALQGRKQHIFNKYAYAMHTYKQILRNHAFANEKIQQNVTLPHLKIKRLNQIL